MTKSPDQEPHLGLARKHRPQTFDGIIGQEAVSTTLRNAIADKKPAHAYLFFGPRGVGKTTTARVLAKALNCLKGPTADPCGTCDACREIAQSSAIDVLELDAATHTQVDRIREMILETVSLAPSRDRYKVFIIDEVHMLSTASFNALLKTLEEPPPHVVFILATTDPGKIPATIVSRCQRFRFRPMPLDIVAEHLQRLCKAEGIKAEPAALEMLARACGGSVRDAVSLLEQAHVYADGKIEAEKIRELLGSLPEEYVLTVAGALLERNAETLARALDRILEEGADPSQLLRDLRERLHACHLHRLGVDQTLDSAWKALADPHAPDTVAYLVQRTNKLLEGLRSADSPRLALEIGLYGMLEGAYDVGQWVRRLETLEKRMASGGSSVHAEPAPQIKPAAETPRPSPKSADAWSAVLEKIKSEKPGLAEDLRASRLVPGEGKEWRLFFRRSFELERAKNNQKLLEARLSEVTGRPVGLILEIDASAGSSPVPVAEKSPVEGRRAATGGESVEDPGVKKVLEIFPGKVRQVKKK